MIGNQSIISIISNYFATILIGITLVGWLSTPAAANGDDEPTKSTLSGYVYADLNLNGIRNLSDTGIADFEVRLDKLVDSDYILVGTDFSNEYGLYEFEDLDAGIYSITQPTLPMGVRNVFVREGELRDIVTGDPLSANAGTAVLLDQSQGILPHIEGIELPDRAWGTDYNFGQIYLGKANYIVPEICIIPEPSTGLLLAFGGLLLGTIGCRSGKR